MSLFNEVELFANPDAPEADQEEILPPKNRSHKRKGKKEENLQGFLEEHFSHPVTDEEADAFFGEGCWRRMNSQSFVIPLLHGPFKGTLLMLLLEGPVIIRTNSLEESGRSR